MRSSCARWNTGRRKIVTRFRLLSAGNCRIEQSGNCSPRCRSTPPPSRCTEKWRKVNINSQGLYYAYDVIHKGSSETRKWGGTRSATTVKQHYSEYQKALYLVACTGLICALRLRLRTHRVLCESRHESLLQCTKCILRTPRETGHLRGCR